MDKIKNNQFNYIALVGALILAIGSVIITINNSNSNPKPINEAIYRSVEAAEPNRKIVDDNTALINNLKKIAPEKLDNPQLTKVEIKATKNSKTKNISIPLSNEWKKSDDSDGSDNMFIANQYIFAEFGTQSSVKDGKNLTVKQMVNNSVSENDATVVGQFEKTIGGNSFLVTVMNVKNDNAYVIIYNKNLNYSNSNDISFHAQVFFSKQMTNDDGKKVYRTIAHLEQSLSDINW